MPLSIFFVVAVIAALIQPATIQANENVPRPTAVIDLGALVTPDLPARMNGSRWLSDLGYTEPNSFNVIRWTNGPISGQNSYYTFFNHGGPHVDAPIHFGFGGGLDAYPIESFSGPVRVFDVSNHAPGYSVPLSVFEGQSLTRQDIVIIYTGYVPPQEGVLPKSIALTRAAAEYLANIPIRAFGTDSFSVGSRSGAYPVTGDTEVVRRAPVHEAFLSKVIPIYEVLQNVDQLLGRENLYFVGVPLNVENGDGMLVRPVVFVY